MCFFFFYIAVDSRPYIFVFPSCSRLCFNYHLDHFKNRDKRNLPFTPILASVNRLIRYHLGTVAKGSFIITLVKIPRMILMYIHSQLKGKVRVLCLVRFSWAHQTSFLHIVGYKCFLQRLNKVGSHSSSLSPIYISHMPWKKMSGTAQLAKCPRKWQQRSVSLTVSLLTSEQNQGKWPLTLVWERIFLFEQEEQETKVSLRSQEIHKICKSPEGLTD